MKHILFIVNPISGIGKQKKIEQVVDANLDHSLFEYEVVYTEYIHHGKELALQARQGDYDAIVAVGGDGSVNDVVSGLLNQQYSGDDIDKDCILSNVNSPTLGIIPCGSGNGLARNLKIPLNPAHAIRILNRYNEATIDTINLATRQGSESAAMQSRIIASIAGIGFDARVARLMKQAKVRGLQAYARIIANEYFSYKEHTYRISIDGEEMERKAWFISIANSNQFGFNTAIAPLAKLDDGLIDVCIVDKIPLHHLALSAPLLYLNHFELSQHVEYFKARRVSIYNNEEGWVNIDGEGEELGKELHFTNIPKSLKILIP